MKKLTLAASVGLLAFVMQSASGQTTLFTTYSDFTGWAGSGGVGGSTVNPVTSTIFDYDNSIINGAANTPGTSGGGSLEIQNNSAGNYNAMAYSYGFGFNQAAMTAIDPGSTAYSYPPPTYTFVAGDTVAYSGIMTFYYTLPDNEGGNYLQLGVDLSYNGDNGYGYSFGSSSFVGTVNGYSTYLETIPYTIAASTLSYFSIGIAWNSNYNPILPWYVDDIQVVPEPGTMALLGMGGLGFAFITRRRVS